jgi:ADP-heptose:LPS heptosyltransferase
MTLNATYKQTTILAIRLRQLGDILATLGTLRALKDAEPDRRIAFLVDAHYHDMLRDVEFVDQLVPQPPKITGLDAIIDFQKYVEDLRGLGADYALDFHCNTRSALLTYLSGAPVRIGFDVRIRKLVYTEVEPRAIFANGRTLPRTSHESAMALGTRCTITDLQGSVLNTINVDPGRMNEGRRMALSVGVTA